VEDADHVITPTSTATSPLSAMATRNGPPWLTGGGIGFGRPRTGQIVSGGGSWEGREARRSIGGMMGTARLAKGLAFLQ